MKKHKFGFTLGEVLVSMAVVGIIMALAAHTLKIAKSSYTSMTYHAFNNVNMLVSELISGQRAAVQETDDGNGGTVRTRLRSPIVTCKKGENGMLTTILAPDIIRNVSDELCINVGYGETPTAPENLFCNYLVYYANTSGKTRCDLRDDGSSALFTVGFNDARYEPTIEGVLEHWNEPNFVAVNGHRYYISEWTTDNRVSTVYGFRIVAVDLNGTGGPNVLENDGSSQLIPDIVQFLVLDNGEVYPLGVAGNNLRVTDYRGRQKTVMYLNTRVKGYNFRDDDSRTENIPSSCIIKKQDGSQEQICNFGVVYLQIREGESFFSYKEALCGAFAGTPNLQYPEYCYRDLNRGGGEDSYITRNYLCPPSSSDKRFDQCDIKIVKPVFRYNLK
ncbi:MAG: prepilin-type N-terminal cleavage/methylation domain-containing protein [Candidatus Gastranaerophilales bacterium]|nr:prepilin-type N-terminal cleavage/methylation domain-containing protein [Candidatus Gastranaerophilales bacterium]